MNVHVLEWIATHTEMHMKEHNKGSQEGICVSICLSYNATLQYRRMYGVVNTGEYQVQENVCVVNRSRLENGHDNVQFGNE